MNYQVVDSGGIWLVKMAPSKKPGDQEDLDGRTAYAWWLKQSGKTLAPWAVETQSTWFRFDAQEALVRSGMVHVETQVVLALDHATVLRFQATFP